MMNNFKEFSTKYSFSSDLTKIQDIQWKTQDSSSGSLLFYKFNLKTDKEKELFLSRIEGVEFAFCIVNDLEFEDPRILTIKTSEFVESQEDALEILYPINFNSFKTIGITGTNGKTTTVDLIRQLAIQEKMNVLTVGTLGVYLNENKIKDYGLTTPAYIDLIKLINEYQNQIDIIAMEVSSHALIQKRFGKIRFNQTGWTSFSQDHLDYHKTLEEYFQAKSKVLDYLKDDGFLFIPKNQKEILNKLEDNKVSPIECDDVPKNSFFNANFNQENLAIAKHCLQLDNIKTPDDLKAPPGRFNVIDYKEAKIIIDFAHTPDAVSSICEEIKKSFPTQKLITLFGCGGDRDRTKRPLMAKAASEHSDLVYLTSDNPRFEDPEQIINDAKVGLSGKNKIIIDRKLAIKDAIENIENSVLLIAGKGHEEYLDIKGVKHPYSDEQTVKDFIC